jgi:hypothetical protein
MPWIELVATIEDSYGQDGMGVLIERVTLNRETANQLGRVHPQRKKAQAKAQAASILRQLRLGLKIRGGLERLRFHSPNH